MVGMFGPPQPDPSPVYRDPDPQMTRHCGGRVCTWTPRWVLTDTEWDEGQLVETWKDLDRPVFSYQYHTKPKYVGPDTLYACEACGDQWHDYTSSIMVTSYPAMFVQSLINESGTFLSRLKKKKGRILP